MLPKNQVTPAFVQFAPEFLVFFQLPALRPHIIAAIAGETHPLAYPSATDDDTLAARETAVPVVFVFNRFHRVLTEHNDPLDALLAATDLPWLDLFVPTSEVFLAFLFHYTKFVYFSLKASKTPVTAVGNVFGLLEFATA